MNLTLYKQRRFRQKPHILTIEQSRELGQLTGKKVLKHITDQGLVRKKIESKYTSVDIHKTLDPDQLVSTSKKET